MIFLEYPMTLIPKKVARLDSLLSLNSSLLCYLHLSRLDRGVFRTFCEIILWLALS